MRSADRFLDLIDGNSDTTGRHGKECSMPAWYFLIIVAVGLIIFFVFSD